MAFRSVLPWLFLTLPLAGCARSATEDGAPAAQGCAAGTAHIHVTGGFLRNICGCAEAAGTIAAPPAALTCTVSAGTTVFFRYLSEESQQLGPSGNSSFVASPLSNPKEEIHYRVYPAKFATPGTYDFVDLLNSSITGQIIVQ